MRYWIGFVLFLLALGALGILGCSDEVEPEPKGLPCADECDCDDGNVCTEDSCDESSETCVHVPKVLGVGYVHCDLDGSEDISGFEDGICVAAACEKNRCDDGNECTIDSALHDGSCYHEGCIGTCYPCDWNGEAGVCLDAFECAEDPCKGVACDDDDPCTEDLCSLFSGECFHSTVSCSDDNPCTNDACNQDTGQCEHQPREDGDRFGVGACYEACACLDGVCTGATQLPDGTDCCTKWVCSSWSCGSFGNCGCTGSTCVCHGACSGGTCVERAFEVQP
jgi:hypothetical protein